MSNKAELFNKILDVYRSFAVKNNLNPDDKDTLIEIHEAVFSAISIPIIHNYAKENNITFDQALTTFTEGFKRQMKVARSVFK